MTFDECECGHLLQAHREWPYGGPCHSPTCMCPGFVSVLKPEQLTLDAGQPEPPELLTDTLLRASRNGRANQDIPSHS